MGSGFGRNKGEGDGGEDGQSELSSTSPESMRSMGVGRETRRVRPGTTGLTGALEPYVVLAGNACFCVGMSNPSSSHSVGRDTALVLARGFREISCSLPMGLGPGRRGAALCVRRCVGRTGLALLGGSPIRFRLSTELDNSLTLPL